jgi:hypothetical protein
LVRNEVGHGSSRSHGFELLSPRARPRGHLHETCTTETLETGLGIEVDDLRDRTTPLRDHDLGSSGREIEPAAQLAAEIAYPHLETLARGIVMYTHRI